MSQPSADDLARMIAVWLARRTGCHVRYIAADALAADIAAGIAGDPDARQRVETVLRRAPGYLVDAYHAAQGQCAEVTLEDAIHGLKATGAISGAVAATLLRIIAAQGAADPEARGSLLVALPGGEPMRLRTLEDLRRELRRSWTSDPRLGCRLAGMRGFGRRAYDAFRRALGIEAAGGADAAEG